jgi:hypothetical protein
MTPGGQVRWPRAQSHHAQVQRGHGQTGKDCVRSNHSPPDVFASDLHKPSVDYGKLGQEGNQPLEPTLESDPPEGSNPPSTPEPEVMDINEERLDHDDGPDWHIPYLARLVQGVLPLDQMQARWLARRAKSFVLLDRELYKRSASRILQRCIPTNEGRQLL